jgi:hypothetical protein
VKAGYYKARDVNVLAMFQDLDSKYCWNPKEIKISERGIELSLVTHIFGEIEPVVGDITKTGFSVTNSETGGRPLKASFLAFRLQCSNGAVLPDKWGEVRWTYDKRMSIESSLKNFRSRFVGMQLPMDLLEERFNGLLSNKLTDLDFRKIWRNVSRVVGSLEADSILEIKEDDRKQILRTVKEREKKNRLRLNPDSKIKPVQLNFDFYETMQLVTAKAKKYPFFTKRQLEKIGGNIIG